MENQNSSSCPVECPNRRRDGIILNFRRRSIRLDPFELLLWAMLLLPCGSSMRDAWNGVLDFDASIRRIGVISALGTLIRTSPTEQLYEFLSKIKLGEK